MSAPFSPFLWPDHAISKTQSRAIREEHNALYNSHAELLAEFKAILEKAALQFEQTPTHNGLSNCDAIAKARGMIAKAEGRNAWPTEKQLMAESNALENARGKAEGRA